MYESYRLIFNNDFNIGFGYPRTDTCSACDQFLAKIEIATKTLESGPTNEVLIRDLKQLKFQKDLHQRKADTFYRRKRDAKRRAKITPHLEAFTFDYQKMSTYPTSPPMTFTTTENSHTNHLTFTNYQLMMFFFTAMMRLSLGKVQMRWLLSCMTTSQPRSAKRLLTLNYSAIPAQDRIRTLP